MARVNVFLSQDLLQAVDAEARQAGIRRSAFIQAALTSHLGARRRARETEEAQQRIEDACRRMDALAGRLGAWDPVGVIRAYRDRRSGQSPVRRLRRRAANRA